MWVTTAEKPDPGFCVAWGDHSTWLVVSWPTETTLRISSTSHPENIPAKVAVESRTFIADGAQVDIVLDSNVVERKPR